MKIIDRIFQIIENEKISINEFSKKINVSNGYFAKQKSPDANVGSQILEKTVNNYPEINPEWLLTGKGEMLRNNQTIENVNGNGIVGNNVNNTSGKNNYSSENSTDIQQLKELIAEYQKQIAEKDNQINKLIELPGKFK